MLIELGLELVNEVNETPRPVNQGHPHLALDLGGRGLRRGVMDPGAFDAIPYRLATAGPLHEAIDTFGNIPQEVGSVGFFNVSDWIDVERDDVGAANVSQVIV